MGRRGGIALDFRRGKTSKERLKLEWVYPVWKPVQEQQAAQSTGTVAQQSEYALPLKEAYELVASGDKRPLLVLRECERCKGTDHALLSRTLDNEQTVLLAHWFRCVKMPPNITDGKHPFYNLFAKEKEGDKIPHLYFCDSDGGNKAALPGDQSQAQLWEVMFSFLERSYVGDLKKNVKELRGILAQFDRIDERDVELKARLDKEIEKNGPDSDKAKKIEADLAEVASDREKLLAREKGLRAVSMRDINKPKAEAPAGAGAK
jgi:hypothetical protein